MTTLAPVNKTLNRVILPEGTHVARVVGFINMGTALDTYMGEPKWFNKIRLTWEFLEETKVFKEGEDAKPLVQSQEYTFSMHPKSKLRPVIEGIIGTTLTDEEAYAFDFDNLMGQACLVSIKHDKTAKGIPFSKVAGTSKLMKGQVAKSSFNTPKMLTFDKWDQSYFDNLPKFVKERIEKSEEYKSMKGIKVEEVKVDDLSF